MRRLVWFAACASIAMAAIPEEPVGLVLNPGGGQLLRADAETPLAARSGDLLFSGDGLRTSTNAASFLFCPGKSLETLSSSGEVRLDDKKPKVRSGSISEQPARSCALPKTLRVASASQQHYGVTMTRGVAGEVKPVPRNQLPADVTAELAGFDAALAANAQDQAALVGSAAVFEAHNLPANALEMYYRLRTQWPDAAWLKSKIFDLEETAAAQSAAAPAAAGGQTYALLIGVSKYARPELSLQFAHSDAQTFSQLLSSQRGGGVPPSNILLLTDEKATTAAVRNGFQDFLKRRATKNDTVIILVAGHGTVETPGNKNAYILTYDADPQDLNSTALPMAELQSLFEDQLKKVGRVLLFVDVCKAGTIGSIQNTSVNSNVQQLGDIDGDLFGLLASRPREVSFEGPEFGGGHGAFSYFVMKGMGGAADKDGNKIVTASELIDYVSEQVPDATRNKQHPREFGVYDNAMRLAEVDKPGINLASFPLLDPRTGDALLLTQNNPQALTPQAQQDFDRFNQAIAQGRLLPGQPNNAFDALRPLANQFTPQRYLETQNQLRIALENAAQKVLLKYLQGDQTPPVRDDFALAAQYMDAARTLTRESLYLEARDTFFQGRALLFDKRYTDAAPLLEQSVRLDPGAAYSYNALGIAYLEQARFDEAIPAFRDAANRAQHWSYPLHNLALSYVETGDYQNAIRAYQKAIELTPDYSYLPYNLGLVYQRLNRRKDAEKSYRQALKITPDAAETYNALGTLKAADNKTTEAEQFYRDALQRNPALLPARHNLAILLAAQPNRRTEAITLLRENVQRSPQFVASQLSLAETLEAAGDNAAAAQAYRQTLTLTPNYTAARIALARTLLAAGDLAGAADQAQQSSAYELLGDIRTKQSLTADARTSYEAALAQKPERTDRKRIESKLKTLR